jgi:multiple sugar transport system substrate-binding protein
LVKDANKRRLILLDQDYLTSSTRINPTSAIRCLIFVLIPVILSLLAACDSQPSPTFTPNATSSGIAPTLVSTEITATPTITLEPTSALGIDASNLDGLTISFWHPWSGEAGQAIQESIEEFNAANKFGITVEGTFQGNYNALYERINSAEAKDGLPNLTVASNYQILSWDVQGKRVVDLNAYFADPEWGFTAEEQVDFYNEFLEQDVIDRKRIAFPAIRSTQLMFYNKSWANELGFSSPPTTPEEFKDQTCSAARSKNANDLIEDDGKGGWVINTNPSAVLSWMYAYDSPIIHPNGDSYQFNTPQSEEALIFLKDLIDAGCAWEAPETPAEIEFANRNALFITASLVDLSYQITELERANNIDTWIVMGFPSVVGKPVIDIYGLSYVLFSETPEENLASWIFIKWLTSPQQQARFITATGTFPTRASTLNFLDQYTSQNPQWEMAQELLENAKPEPTLQSWDVVRWVLGDVGTQIFRYYYTPDRIPATIELLDETAAELHTRTK